MRRVGLHAVLCALMCLSLPACVSVHLDGAGGEQAVVRHVGWLQIKLPESDKAIVAELRGLGLMSTPAGMTLGYTSERWAVMGADCRAVLWVPERSPLDAATLAQMERLAGVCLVTPRSGSNDVPEARPARLVPADATERIVK